MKDEYFRYIKDYLIKNTALQHGTEQQVCMKCFRLADFISSDRSTIYTEYNIHLTKKKRRFLLGLILRSLKKI